MNKTIIILFGLVILAFSMLSCNDKTVQTSEKRAINPNGDSELALLMRQMFDEGMKMKVALKEGEKYNFTHNPEKILSAQATEPDEVATEEFKAFARQYILTMEQYKMEDVDQAKTHYRGMVKSCQNCHESFCLGPLRRIKKLEI